MLPRLLHGEWTDTLEAENKEKANGTDSGKRWGWWEVNFQNKPSEAGTVIYA